LQKAITYFRDAIARDPDYTLAWVGLADTLILSYEYGYATKVEALPEAKSIIQELLKLHGDMAEVNTTAALFHEAKREVTTAIQKFEKAISLRPNYGEAHNWLS
jgi:Tfp pilus assembly protein PilF